jgi:uncharacterized BrkB/YihY/UPF0761 family membrane protein
MKAVGRLMAVVDGWQRRHRLVAIPYAVSKKFGDDQANLYVVALGWYGFTAIYPLLLVVVTIFGFIGAASLGTGIIHTLQHFPVIGSDVSTTNGKTNLHGSVIGLVVGVAGLLYGAQGVTQTAQQAYGQVWNVAEFARPGFLPRLGRSLAGLLVIGGAFFLNAFVGSVAVSSGHSAIFRIVPVAVLLLVDIALYLAAFVILTPKAPAAKRFLPGAITGGAGFTLLTTLGTGLVQHQLRHTTATYGAFASVIGVVTYLLLLAKLSVFSAELNTVVARHLWPRSLVAADPTDADERVLRDLARQGRRSPDKQAGDWSAPASPPPPRARSRAT